MSRRQKAGIALDVGIIDFTISHSSISNISSNTNNAPAPRHLLLFWSGANRPTCHIIEKYIKYILLIYISHKPYMTLGSGFN